MKQNRYFLSNTKISDIGNENLKILVPAQKELLGRALLRVTKNSIAVLQSLATEKQLTLYKKWLHILQKSAILLVTVF